MKKNEIEPRIKEWADMMVNYSLGRQFKEKDDSIEGKLVIINGEDSTKPLIQAFAHSILEAGGHPYQNTYFSTQIRGATAGLPEMESGSEEQLTYVPKFMTAMFEEAGAQIYLLGSKDPFLFSDYQNQVSAVKKATEKLLNIRVSKPWTLTLYPTEEEATMEGFSNIEGYKDFLIDASIIDYFKLAENQRGIKELMDSAETVRLRTYDPVKEQVCNLEVEIGKNIVESCEGVHNVPDGEVYTSPNTSRIEGKVVLDVPVMFNGVEIAGVYLEIKDGKITDYRAEKGGDALKEIIETDEGSHRMGEMAVGTNPGIQRALKSPLFAEKIGGTCHMAIGRPYKDCYSELEGLEGEELKTAEDKLIADGRYHRSAQHVDIPTDFRTPEHGQALYIGNTEVKWNNDGGLWEVA